MVEDDGAVPSNQHGCVADMEASHVYPRCRLMDGSLLPRRPGPGSTSTELAAFSLACLEATKTHYFVAGNSYKPSTLLLSIDRLLIEPNELE
jgi:hypothetical protein